MKNGNFQQGVNPFNATLPGARNFQRSPAGNRNYPIPPGKILSAFSYSSGWNAIIAVPTETPVGGVALASIADYELRVKDTPPLPPSSPFFTPANPVESMPAPLSQPLNNGAAGDLQPMVAAYVFTGVQSTNQQFTDLYLPGIYRIQFSVSGTSNTQGFVTAYATTGSGSQIQLFGTADAHNDATGYPPLTFNSKTAFGAAVVWSLLVVMGNMGGNFSQLQWEIGTSNAMGAETIIRSGTGVPPPGVNCGKPPDWDTNSVLIAGSGLVGDPTNVDQFFRFTASQNPNIGCTWNILGTKVG